MDIALNLTAWFSDTLNQQGIWKIIFPYLPNLINSSMFPGFTIENIGQNMHVPIHPLCPDEFLEVIASQRTQKYGYLKNQ